MNVRTIAGAAASVASRLVMVGIVAGIWELCARTGMVDAKLLPSFTDTMVRLWHQVADPAVRLHLLLTSAEVLLALVISIPLGAAVGILVAENRYWGDVLRPLLYFPMSMPKSVFLPLFVLLLGITLTEKVAFGVFSTVFIIVMSTATAIESVLPNHVMVAKSCGATRMQIISRVYVPSMLPLLLEGVRLAMIFDLTGILIAEMYGARSGIGYLITSWGDSFAIGDLLAGILLVSFVAILFNEAIRGLEHVFGSWRTT
ncbi:MAG TPA: ABC transporter permease subunit [Ramlibacter sp.]|uniref:ABC transporter permease n=1 Tax=Ramlibacter sp. TaxID=1917967 RepID=UPI002CB5DEBB|nr:ABC transporter permease subunit [Ramlibacter sp.]HVZ45431.1 ABC transporter permease subunit [Ramlibacter sp.]